MASAELKLCQEVMDKYDGSLEKIRGWAVTLWIASLGWSFQVKRKEVVLLSIVVLFTFWILDGLNKSYREGYKARRDTIAKALREFFDRGSLPADFSSPNLPFHIRRFHETVKNMFRFHASLVYIILLVVSVILYAEL